MDPGSICYVLDESTCTADQWKTVVDGTALVRNWIVVDKNSTAAGVLPGGVNGTNSTGSGGNGTRPSGTGGAPPQQTVSNAGRLGIGRWEMLGWAGLFGLLVTFL